MLTTVQNYGVGEMLPVSQVERLLALDRKLTAMPSGQAVRNRRKDRMCSHSLDIRASFHRSFPLFESNVAYARAA